MEIRGKKFVVIYLEDWQIRMVKDFLGVDCHTWTVELGGGSVVRYGVGPPDNSKVKKLFLTDWQKRELRDEAGEVCDFIELEQGVHVLYGVPPDKLGA